MAMRSMLYSRIKERTKWIVKNVLGCLKQQIITLSKMFVLKYMTIKVVLLRLVLSSIVIVFSWQKVCQMCQLREGRTAWTWYSQDKHCMRCKIWRLFN